MYSGLTKEKAQAVVSHGEDIMALAIDQAHNFGLEDQEYYEDIPEEVWAIIARWEKHIRTQFTGMVKDMEFDLERGNFDLKEASGE